MSIVAILFMTVCVSVSQSQFQFGPNTLLFTPEASAARTLILQTYTALLNLQGRSCPRCSVKFNKELIDLDDDNERLDPLEREMYNQVLRAGVFTDTPAVTAARQLLLLLTSSYLRLVGRAACENCAGDFLEEILEN